MKAIGLTEFGGPDVLHVVDLPTPEPGPTGPVKTESEIPQKYADPMSSNRTFTVKPGKNEFDIELAD